MAWAGTPRGVWGLLSKLNNGTDTQEEVSSGAGASVSGCSAGSSDMLVKQAWSGHPTRGFL